MACVDEGVFILVFCKDQYLVNAIGGIGHLKEEIFYSLQYQ